MRWPRSMKLPRRFSRSAEGSCELWSTRLRVLKKSVGLKPSATPFLRLMRPASSQARGAAYQLK